MIKHTKAIAGNSDLWSAQAFVYDQGQNLAAVLVSGSGEDAFNLIRNTALDLESDLFDETKSIEERFTDIFAKFAKIKVANLQILLNLVYENVLYIQSLGAHSAYLFRENKLATLADSSSIDTLNPQVSGHFKDGDRLILSTSVFKNEIIHLSEEQLNLLVSTDFETFQDYFESEIAKGEIYPQAVVLLENIVEEDEPVVERPSLKNNPFINIKHYFWYVLRNKRLKKVAIFLSIMLTVAFLLLGFIKIREFNTQNTENKQLSEIKNELQTALNLKDSDPDKAKSSLSKAKELYSKIASKDSNFKSMDTEIADVSAQVLKIYEVAELSLFLDLNLIKENFRVEKLSYSHGKFLFLDTNLKNLVLFNIEQKSQQVLAGESQLGMVKFASINGDNYFSYSNEKGALKVGSDKKVVTVSPKDSEWGEIVGIVGFANNLYILDTGKNQIWKYVPIVSGYSDKFKYFAGTPDLTGARLMMIDSSVWILKFDNEIQKYTQGNRDHFALNGLDKNLEKVVSFYVSDETEKLYLLEKDRIVVLDKTGKYFAQINSSEFEKIKDLYVDEPNKTIYLLDGEKIYTTGLKI